VAYEVHYANEVEWAIRIRNASIERMRTASVRHGMHAVETGNRIGPHAVLFLYHDRGHGAVHASYRMFGDRPEFLRIPDVLRTLTEVVAGHPSRGGRFDPRLVLAQGTDEAMPANARFVGVGVSTLDTAAGAWTDVRDRVDSALDVPGRAYIALIDGTKVILERGGPFGANGTTWSSHQLELNLDLAAFGSWRRLIRDPHDPDESVWAGLDALLAHIGAS
jgi:hypothetical protein